MEVTRAVPARPAGGAAVHSARHGKEALGAGIASPAAGKRAHGARRAVQAALRALDSTEAPGRTARAGAYREAPLRDEAAGGARTGSACDSSDASTPLAVRARGTAAAVATTILCGCGAGPAGEAPRDAGGARWCTAAEAAFVTTSPFAGGAYRAYALGTAAFGTAGVAARIAAAHHAAVLVREWLELARWTGEAVNGIDGEAIAAGAAARAPHRALPPARGGERTQWRLADHHGQHRSQQHHSTTVSTRSPAFTRPPPCPP